MKHFIHIPVLVFLILIQCTSYESRESTSTKIISQPIHTEQWIWISEDPMLKQVLKDRFSSDLFTRESDDFSKIASVEVQSIQSEILTGKAVLYSLATLTMGIFEEIDSEHIFTIKYLDGIKVDEKKFKVQTKMKFQAPMPPYLGLGSTLTLAIFDRHRKPEHLQSFCMKESISRTREIFEANKTWYCEEYKKHLSIAWESVENLIEQDLLLRSQKN